jgi:hypothetical protein
MIAWRCPFKTKLESEKRASLSKQPTRTAPPIPRHCCFLRELDLVGACTNSNFLCYNCITEHGQMLGVAIACGRFLGGFSYCPFTVHFVLETGRRNGLKQAKRLTVRIDSKHAGLALTV